MRCCHITGALSLIVLYCCGNVSCDCILPTNRINSDDLTKSEAMLKKLEPLQGKIFNTTEMITKKDGNKVKFSYSVSICTSLDQYSYASDPPTAGVVQIDAERPTDDYSTYKVVGRINGTSVKGGTDWIMLTYKYGDSYQNHCKPKDSNEIARRQAHIMVVCNPEDTKGSLKILYEDNAAVSAENCFYLFELSTNIVCSNYNSGLSGGSIFLIVFFTVMGTYLLVGMAYKRYVYGSKGLEQVPNIGFWKLFGALQADGCDFLCRCNGYADNFSNDNPYRGIADDQLDGDDRDDENLLPM